MATTDLFRSGAFFWIIILGGLGGALGALYNQLVVFFNRIRERCFSMPMLYRKSSITAGLQRQMSNGPTRQKSNGQSGAQGQTGIRRQQSRNDGQGGSILVLRAWRCSHHSQQGTRFEPGHGEGILQASSGDHDV